MAIRRYVFGALVLGVRYCFFTGLKGIQEILRSYRA
jgi:hypothetical protein